MYLNSGPAFLEALQRTIEQYDKHVYRVQFELRHIQIYSELQAPADFIGFKTMIGIPAGADVALSWISLSQQQFDQRPMWHHLYITGRVLRFVNDAHFDY